MRYLHKAERYGSVILDWGFYEVLSGVGIAILTGLFYIVRFLAKLSEDRNSLLYKLNKLENDKIKKIENDLVKQAEQAIEFSNNIHAHINTAIISIVGNKSGGNNE